MKSIIILSICLFLYSGCTLKKKESVDLGKVKNEVISADIAFSKLSADSGYQKAFVAYAAENMVRLNPRQSATFGRNQLIEEFKKDTGSPADAPTLTWKPLHVEVADAGDFASAFGDWEIRTRLPGNKDTILYGNYITVWKKQSDGTWKFILDGGNPTPGPTDLNLLTNLNDK
ncbi:MAG: DUF4440 domain-containing protein [Chitinophagaceae bacterium]